MRVRAPASRSARRACRALRARRVHLKGATGRDAVSGRAGSRQACAVRRGDRGRSARGVDRGGALFPSFPRGGGFAWLRREGTGLTTVRLPYAVTDTAPGHASLHTGRSGGVWDLGQRDPACGWRERHILARPDREARDSAWNRRKGRGFGGGQKVDTVADRLRAAHPDAVTIAISLKDRARSCRAASGRRSPSGSTKDKARS